MNTQKSSAQLKTLAQAINQEIQTIAQSSFNTGKYLAQAKELFTIASQFVKWAESECNLKKAQVYRLVSVYNTYKNEKALHTLSVDVLATLSGCSEDVKEIVKAIAANGEAVSLKELKEIKAETEGKPAPKAAKKEELKAEKVSETLTQQAKQANAVIKDLETQMKKSDGEKKAAISAANKAQSDLELAMARIKLLESENAQLSKVIKTLEETNHGLTLKVQAYEEQAQAVAVEVVEVEEVKEESSVLETEKEADQLEIACIEYVRLLKLNPRQMVNNTVQAVEYAGGEVKGSGRMQTFVLDGITMTGQEVRCEAAHYNN